MARGRQIKIKVEGCNGGHDVKCMQRVKNSDPVLKNNRRNNPDTDTRRSQITEVVELASLAYIEICHREV